MKHRVLIIDDELALEPSSAQFRRLYEPPEYEFVFVGTERQMRVTLTGDPLISAVLLDMRFAGYESDHGLRILATLSQQYPCLPVVVMSSRRDPDTLIRAWDLGARAYLVKWSDNPHFGSLLADKLRLHARTMRPKKLLGESAPIRKLRDTIQIVAQYDVSVLIEGETGTGKEVVAELIHEQSDHREKPLLKINCAAITEGLVESELFGHKRGSFTGAIADKRGLVEAAVGGTIMLDEVSELSRRTQQTLLRFLDRGEYVRVGETHVRHAGVRIIAATNRPLRDLVKAGEFREDLYHRLNQFHIATPALREIPEDIPLLAEHFLDSNRNRHWKPVEGFEPTAMETICRYRWSGNVRQLAQTVARAYILTPRGMIGLESLPEDMAVTMQKAKANEAGITLTGSLREYLARTAWRYIQEILRQEVASETRGARKRAAERLGLNTANGLGRKVAAIRRDCPELSAEIEHFEGDEITS